MATKKSRSRSTSSKKSPRARTGSASSKGSARQQDAIALLKEDHQKVRKLLSQLEKAEGESRRTSLLGQIEKEVKIHTQIEEEIFYPAFRDAAKKKDDMKLFFEAVEEHHVVDLVMPEAKETSPGGEEFAAKAKVIKDLIEHHAEEEEKEMFPRARKLFDSAELRELGGRMKKRKTQLGGQSASS
ncbi:MAG TPA: hemerythrin domain-containing protein [Thermoanaerobaculia bacterium]|nr:hemerythrin domain-containing protein [Thermoanaerobaculia bacterium]